MLFWTALLALSVNAADKPLFKSGPQRVSLLELYSSEGCSSCPPADEWLSSLAKEKGLWSEFVPVAFQVDYWDRLGWKDPLASPEFTARQQRYAAAWGNGSVYTPGLVLNGRELRGWGERPPAKLTEQVGTLVIEEEGPLLFGVRFAAPARSGKRLVAHGALLGFGFTSSVKAGENEGKTLRHDFAALDSAQGALDEKGTTRLRLRKRPGTSPARLGAAFWITAGDDPTPRQAAGGYLP